MAIFQPSDMAPFHIRDARIMAECGCTLEDICFTLDLSPDDAWCAIAPVVREYHPLFHRLSAWLYDYRRRLRMERLRLKRAA